MDIDAELVDEPDISEAVAFGDHNFTDLKEFALHSAGAAPSSNPPHGSNMSADPVCAASHQSAHSLSHILNPTTHHNKSEPISSSDSNPLPYDSVSLYSSIYGADTSSMDVSSFNGTPVEAPLSPALSICPIPSMDESPSLYSSSYEGDASSMDGSSFDNTPIETPASPAISAHPSVNPPRPPISPTQSDNEPKSDGSLRKLAAKGKGLLGWLKGGSSMKKRKSPSGDVDSDGSEKTNQARKPSKQPKVLKEEKSLNVGISKSATLEREQREQVKNDVFVLYPVKFSKWKVDILAMDKNAVVDEKAVYWVRHSICGKTHKSKRSYDRTWFRRHVNVKCHLLKHPAPAARTPILSQIIEKSAPLQRSFVVTRVTRACPGLTSHDDPRITTYLRRSGASGGGARSITTISKILYNKFFRKLSSTRQKEVITTQHNELKWRNEHTLDRVIATDCLKTVKTSTPDEHPHPCPSCDHILRLPNFRKALAKQVPKDEDFKYVNK